MIDTSECSCTLHGLSDLLETDVLKMYRQVLTEEEVQVKVGVKTQFGYLSRMTLTNIGVMKNFSVVHSDRPKHVYLNVLSNTRVKILEELSGVTGV